MGCSNQSGIAIESITCRSPRRSGRRRAARQVLRGDRRASRYGPKSPIHIAFPMVAMEPPTGFDAAAIRSKRAEVLGRDPRRQDDSGGVVARRRRRSAGQKNEGLSARAQCSSRLERQDLCRNTGRDKRLAFGRRAIFPTHRQAHGATQYRDSNPLQTGAYAAFQSTPFGTLRPNSFVLRIAPDEETSFQYESRRGPAIDLAAVKWTSTMMTRSRRDPNVGTSR